MTGVFLTGRGLSARQNKKGLRLNRVNTLWTVCYRVYFITKKPTICTECAKLYILWEKHSKNFIMMCCWTSLHRLWPYPLLVWSAICECVCVCASVCVYGSEQGESSFLLREEKEKDASPFWYVQQVRSELKRGWKCSHFSCVSVRTGELCWQISISTKEQQHFHPQELAEKMSQWKEG